MRKNKIALLCALLGICLTSQLTNAQVALPQNFPVKTEKEIRFQICVVSEGAGMPLVLKIDTLTGQTWHLQMTTEEDRKRGIYYVWTEVPTFLAPDLSKPVSMPANTPPDATK